MAKTVLIKDFLNFLADNPDKEKKFDDDAVTVMTDFGLTPDQQELILHGTIKQIRKAVKKEVKSGFEVFMIKMK